MSESSSSEDVESVIPASQAARFVVYATNTVSDYEACRSIVAILDGLTVEQRAVVRRSKFTSSLRKKLKVSLKDFPIVFIGGRYVGGLNEVRQLKQTCQIESLVESLPVVESGVCLDCGGYKFLLDGWDLITCTACDGTGLERLLCGCYGLCSVKDLNMVSNCSHRLLLISSKHSLRYTMAANVITSPTPLLSFFIFCHNVLVK